MALPPVKCRACGKPFNATFRVCPFCNAKAATMVNDFAAFAETAVKRQEPFIKLTFHPAALKALDLFFAQTWGEDGQGEKWMPTQGVALPLGDFGVFFGEVLRRVLQGQWEEDAQDPAEMMRAAVVMPNGHRIVPLQTVLSRFRLGASVSFSALFDEARAKSGVPVSSTEADGWLSYAEFFEQLGRADLSAQFVERANALRSGAAVPARIATPKQALALKPLEDAVALGTSLLEARSVRTDRGAMTLAGVDLVVTELFGEGPATVQTLAALARERLGLGAFIGSVLCRRFNTTWTFVDGAELTTATVAWEKSGAVNPFELLDRRLASGSATSILGQVAVALRPALANKEAVDPPEIPEEWAAQAEAFAQAKHMAWALVFGNAALKDGYPSIGFRAKVAQWACGMKKFNEAAALLKDAPREYPVLMQLAALASAQGQYDVAIEHTQQAILLAPERGEMLRETVRMLQALREV